MSGHLNQPDRLTNQATGNAYNINFNDQRLSMAS